jgi:hypothetical protein
MSKKSTEFIDDVSKNLENDKTERCLNNKAFVKVHQTDRDDITAILLTVALNTITLTLQQAAMFSGSLQQKHVREIGL